MSQIKAVPPGGDERTTAFADPEWTSRSLVSIRACLECAGPGRRESARRALRSLGNLPKFPPTVEPSLGVWELYTHLKSKVSQVGVPVTLPSRFACGAVSWRVGPAVCPASRRWTSFWQAAATGVSQNSRSGCYNDGPDTGRLARHSCARHQKSR
jgi:hypothetical protein